MTFVARTTAAARVLIIISSGAQEANQPILCVFCFWVWAGPRECDSNLAHAALHAVNLIISISMCSRNNRKKKYKTEPMNSYLHILHSATK